jgi:hypothetical protein
MDQTPGRAGDEPPPTDNQLASEDPHHPLAVRKAAMMTAAVGAIHAILLLSTVALIRRNAPGATSSDEEIVAYYSDPDNRRIVLIAGLYLIPFAGIAFIWFFVALRMWVSGSARRENIMLSNVQLVCGIIFTALLFGAGASFSVMAASVELTDAPIDPLLARQFPQYGSSMLLVFSMRMAAMFVLTTSNICRGTGIMPRWFTLLGFVVAVGLLLTASFNSLLIVVFPGWILIFCAILFLRARRVSKDLVLPPRSAPGRQPTLLHQVSDS